MKKILLSLLFAASLFSACKKDDKEEQVFTDKLTFGTGMVGFNLTGEGTSFSATGDYIYFRLESKTDFDSNAVKFVVLRDGVNIGPYLYVKDPVPTGHIFITGLTFHVVGSYSVSAYISGAMSEKLVTTGTFEVQ